MTNRKIWLGIIILIIAFSFTNCELDVTVPTWAQGSWYLTPSLGVLDDALRPEAVKITSKEFIPGAITEKIPLIERTTVTISTNNSVYFEAIEIKKTNDAKEVEIGVPLLPKGFPLYK